MAYGTVIKMCDKLSLNPVDFSSLERDTSLGAQLLESAYDDREELAMDIENSGILIAGLIPWSIACSIPLAMLGAGNGAILYAFLLWLIPICYLGTKKKFYPQNGHPSSPPPSRGGKKKTR